MGAWGHKTFQDDTTCDWVYDLQDAEDPITFLKQSLTPENEDYIEYDDGCSILGACEAIYGIKHGSRDPEAEEFTTWVDSNKNLDLSDLTALAGSAAQKVLGDNSELKELWEENEELFPQWREEIESLIRGLSS
jgi:hypothetical protein